MTQERIIRITKDKIRMDSGTMGWMMVPKSKESGSLNEEWDALEPAPLYAKEIYARWRRMKEREHWFRGYLDFIEDLFPWLKNDDARLEVKRGGSK